MISKFSNWYINWYQQSDHPELLAIRNIISQNRKFSFILLGEGDQFGHSNSDGVHFYNIGENTLIRRFFSFLLKFELVNILRPSVISCFGTTNIIPLGLASILTGAKFIPVLTGEISYAVESMPKHIKKFTKLLLKIVFHKACKILVLGANIGRNLIETYDTNPKKIFVYKYKVSKIFNPNVGKDIKLLLNPNGPIVLTICRISPEKGLNYLIEASRILSKEFPKLKIIIKGSSGANASPAEKKYQAKLTKLICKYDLQHHIKILETSHHSEIPKYLSAADVFVLPSISEGLGLVILEALATGVPVVASRVGGIPDVLINEYNGLLVESRDVEGLARAIMKLLFDNKLRKQIIEGGLKTISQIKENDFEDLLSRSILS